MRITQSYGNFKYIVTGYEKFYNAIHRSTSYCAVCGFSLDEVYVYIIERLRRAGLLPSDHNLLCCKCHMAVMSARIEGVAHPVYRPFFLENVKKQWKLVYPDLDIRPRKGNVLYGGGI